MSVTKPDFFQREFASRCSREATEYNRTHTDTISEKQLKKITKCLKNSCNKHSFTASTLPNIERDFKRELDSLTIKPENRSQKLADRNFIRPQDYTFAVKISDELFRHAMNQFQTLQAESQTNPFPPAEERKTYNPPFASPSLPSYAAPSPSPYPTPSPSTSTPQSVPRAYLTPNRSRSKRAPAPNVQAPQHSGSAPLRPPQPSAAPSSNQPTTASINIPTPQTIPTVPQGEQKSHPASNPPPISQLLYSAPTSLPPSVPFASPAAALGQEDIVINIPPPGEKQTPAPAPAAPREEERKTHPEDEKSQQRQSPSQLPPSASPSNTSQGLTVAQILAALKKMSHEDQETILTSLSDQVPKSLKTPQFIGPPPIQFKLTPYQARVDYEGLDTLLQDTVRCSIDRQYVSETNRLIDFPSMASTIRIDFPTIKRELAQIPKPTKDTELSVVEQDLITALHQLGTLDPQAKIAVINPANTKKSLGGDERASTIEGDLMRCTNAQPYLNEALRDGLYPISNPVGAALLTQPVWLFREISSTCLNRPIQISLINMPVDTKNDERVLIPRILSSLYAAYISHATTLVIPPLVCGESHDNPYQVANLILTLIRRHFMGCFTRVCFAVPKDLNFDSYARAIEEAGGGVIRQ